MSASATVLTAFEIWKCSELATRYACPCPEDVMAYLVDVESQALSDLMSLPAANADDMLLKLYPVVLRDLEPKRDEAPLRLGESRSYSYDPEFYEQLIAHLNAVSPPIAAAMEVPPITVGQAEAA